MKNNGLADKKLLLSKALDISAAAEKYCCPQFSAFLDPASAMFIKKNIEKNPELTYKFYGGYDMAERVMFSAKPYWFDGDDFPIKAVLLQLKSDEALTHRDYLGAVLALGLTRDVIGDICVLKNSALMFCKSDIADYVIINLTKIGSKGVVCTEFSGEYGDYVKPNVVREKINVVSQRLDAVVCAAHRISRSACCSLIAAGKVNVNFEQCLKTDLKVCEGDLISVRGLGRIRFIGTSGMSRKGRLYLDIDRYV